MNVRFNVQKCSFHISLDICAYIYMTLSILCTCAKLDCQKTCVIYSPLFSCLLLPLLQ